MANDKLIKGCAALASTQLLTVVGILYLKSALSNMDKPIEPVVFALVREVLAGIILLVFSYLKSGKQKYKY